MKGKIKYYLGLANSYYKKYGLWTIFYLFFIEFILCVVIVRFIYFFKSIMYSGGPVLVNDYFMYLDPSDPGASREMFIFGIREPTSTILMKKILKNKDVVIDIGANIGYYVCLEALRVAEVYAFEPVPSNYDLLKKNIDLNYFSNVHTFRYAVGDKCGTVGMVVPDKKNLANIPQDGSKHTSGENIQVDMYTLDYLCKKMDISPDFVRMDVEGYEFFIIQGMKDTLCSMKIGSWVFMEVHTHVLGDRVKDIYAVLKEYGFSEEYCIVEGKNPYRFNYGYLRSLFPGLHLPGDSHTMSFFRKIV